MDNRTQFFVLGNPRSGTSMFRLMLNSHPEIVVPPECGFAHWLSDKYMAQDFDQEEIYEVFSEDVFNSKKFETWHLEQKDILEVLLENKPTSYECAIQCVYLAYAKIKSNGKDPAVLGDKNNYFIDHILELKAIFPKAKFILLIRDGRDVACSYLQIEKDDISSIYKPSLSQSIEDIACEWVLNNEKVLREVGSELFITRYEDLLSVPEETLSKVCEYLNLSFDQHMLSFYKKNDEPKEFLQWKSKTLEKIDKDNVAKYKKILEPKEIENFNEIAIDMLKKFKYE
ncbi:sulfotransferase [Shewanella sp. 3_MG-2023]|uniref:sulfotransferase family protein n=1 Tax=Shewanella sp. 3_MG-2023 TaxID=3062635 RepID=UPI0026E3E53B|nr:sulfotransferase [Shewanella sp. 3_MG-2023]MDO6776601.1 sulfotransferase [Shewanella sp. 3_MG-2023]